MSSLHRFRKLVERARSLGRFCACDLLDENYTMLTPLFISLLACLAVYAVCFIYTIYDGFVINNDWTIILQCLAMGAIAVQAISKFICYYIHRHTLKKVVQYLDNIYSEYQKKSGRYDYALKKNLQKILKCLKIGSIIYFPSFGGLIVLPIFYMIATGKRELALTALIPGVDPNETFGYFLHTVFQSCNILFGGVGFFGADMAMFAIILHVLLHRDIMMAKFHGLNEVTEEEEKAIATSSDLLKDIFGWHQNYNLYLQYIQELFSGFIFIHITTSCVSICTTLFCIVLRVWPFAPALLIFNTSIYAYCGFGQLIVTTNDEVTRMIYEVCIWYRLKVKEQKMIMLMLRKSQNAVTLTVGQIMPLDYNTALQLTKGIYTYLMVLINFLD